MTSQRMSSYDFTAHVQADGLTLNPDTSQPVSGYDLIACVKADGFAAITTTDPPRHVHQSWPVATMVIVYLTLVGAMMMYLCL